MKHNETTNQILTDRFGKDSLIALATVQDGIPHVRTVDGVYRDGAFYIAQGTVSTVPCAVIFVLCLYLQFCSRPL